MISLEKCSSKGKKSISKVNSTKLPELNLEKLHSNNYKLESQNSQQDLINEENIVT